MGISSQHPLQLSVNQSCLSGILHWQMALDFYLVVSQANQYNIRCIYPDLEEKRDVLGRYESCVG